MHLEIVQDAREQRKATNRGKIERKGGAISKLHYLGPPGTFSHQVALDTIPRLQAANESLNLTLQPCETIKSTVQEASKLHSMSSSTSSDAQSISWALLPFENNSNGPVVDSYDILFTSLASSISVVGEYRLPVSHTLLCSSKVFEKLRIGEDGQPDLKGLDVVSSHTQALGQCSSFIASQLRPDVEQIATTSTGEAARRLKYVDEEVEQSKGDDLLHACISCRVCAHKDVYGLTILQDNIQNSNKNVTRFLLIEIGGPEVEAGKCTRLQGLGKDQFVMRMMVRLETAASDVALSELMRQVTSHDTASVTLAIRSIERRSIKDGVDDKETGAEGYWPFIYLIEIQATKTSQQTQEGIDSNADLYLALKQLLIKTRSNNTQHKRASTLTCLGIWSV